VEYFPRLGDVWPFCSRAGDIRPGAWFKTHKNSGAEESQKKNTSRLGETPGKFSCAKSFFQKQVRNSGYPAVFHCLIFYSFIVLVITTLLVMIQYDAGHLLGLELNIFKGFIYVFFFHSLRTGRGPDPFRHCNAAYRRYFLKPETVPNAREDGLVPLLIACMVDHRLFRRGLRIAVIRRFRGICSRRGLGHLSLFAGVTESSGKTLHASLWWLHTVFGYGMELLSYPTPSLFTLLSLPTNASFQDKTARRAPARRYRKLMESSE